MKDTILLIDGSSLIFRAFYALPLLSNADGMFTNGVYGFLTMYEQLIAQFDPKYVLVAFDRATPTFRHEDYKDYKSTRQKAPSELAQQFGILKEVLEAMRVPQLDLDGYEADDIIGTMSRAANEQGVRAILVTGDRDYLQLIAPDTQVYLTKKGITEMVMYDEETLKEEYGVTPAQMIDVKGLMGDKSDNIPGVPGIGEKKALGYIQEYGSIEGLYEHIDEVKGPKTKQVLIDNEQVAYMSRKLGEIHMNVPMDKELDRFAVQPEDEPEVIKWFDRLGFQSLAKKRTDNREIRVFEAAPLLSLAEAGKVLEKMKNSCVSFVTFSDHLNYTMGNVRYLAFGTADESVLVELKEDSDTERFLEALFADPSIEKATFDIKESLYALKKRGIQPKGHIDDIMLVDYLNDPGQTSATLGQLARNVLAADLTDPKNLMGKGKSKVTLTEIPVEQLQVLAAESVWAIDSLRTPLLEKLDSLQMRSLYDEVELPLAGVLADMEVVGFPIDKEALVALGDHFKEELEKLTAEIYEAAGEEFNINSTKQLGQVLFENLQLPVVKKTKTGYSTDIEVLETLQGTHPIIEAILSYRQLQKLQSTYIEGLLASIHPDGRVHTTFKQSIAATGRLASTDPNIQNIPVRSEEGRQIRKAFIPSEGRTLLDADYSQIELRILAHLAQDENMLQAFRDGMDIHTKTAAEVFHREPEDVTPLERSRAKAVNFGIVYGISDFGLSKDLKISRPEAKEYIENYLESYPSIKEYMKRIVEEGKENGFVETILKRRRYIPELVSKNHNIRNFGERIALNTPIQGSAADIIKVAMIGVYNRLQAEGLKSKLILQVHDELILDVEPGEEERAAKLVEEVMRGAAVMSVDLDVDVHFGKNWYEAK